MPDEPAHRSLMRGTRCVLLAAVLAAVAGCAQLPARPDLAPVAALPPGAGSPLDVTTGPAEAARPGASGFRLISEGPEAFVIRARSAELASRTLDVQTYIWHADQTGMYLAQSLLQAADRGVRVRLLVDDMDARGKDTGFAALAAHPNIQMRLFNPFASRRGALTFLSEGVRRFRHLNHRMHNKAWIADNRIAVSGGRNLGDEYFGASEEVNFVDLDFAMIGPVVRAASASFDRYWNSAAAYPVESLEPESVSAARLAGLRTVLGAEARKAAGRYTAILEADDPIQRLLAGDWAMEWTTGFQFISDDPLKATMKERDPRRSEVIAALAPAMQAATVDLTIISPYFVPGTVATNSLSDAARNGARVRVLTNSLVANDVAAVHGGYSRHRRRLLKGGVQLWELKPTAGSSVKASMLGSSGASLHTKALVVDSRTLFVGSYNLDPRSTWLNCEQGVLVENPALSRQLEALFAAQTSGARAWRVSLKDGGLHWSDGQETFIRDPKATIGGRFEAWLARVLRIDAQL